MRIIGIDPGTTITGIGIIEQTENDIGLIHCGSVIMDYREPLPLRLKKIYDECLIAIKRFKPHEFAIETAFYGKNIQSTLKLGQARGVAIIAAANCDLKISEYSPREIKKSVTGNGASSKDQVQFMVKSILSLKERVMQIDSSDAIAVALCHYYCTQNSMFNGGSSRAGSSMWKVFVERNPDRIIK